MNSALWLAIPVGMVVGICVGLGGTSGAFLIPTLVFVFGEKQLRAQGTALLIALLPVWIGPLLPYWRSGNVNWKLGLVLSCGIAVGGYFGAQWAQHLPVDIVRKCFAVMLITVALRMLLQR
ncbi:MAG: sulfite exporter TauE/SafE family protein [Acidobacteriaceae bacterium]|nr:sulfite exporter TauE/SafE family protein [Acidobacteriaceae bacterium]